MPLIVSTFISIMFPIDGHRAPYLADQSTFQGAGEPDNLCNSNTISLYPAKARTTAHGE